MTTHWKFWRIFLFSCIDCSSFCILILLIRNFIFILPTVFMCKTTSNPYWQKYYYMFPTHTCGESTLQKRTLTWSVSIEIHSFPWNVCTHTQQQVSRSTLQYFIYTTHSTVHNIWMKGINYNKSKKRDHTGSESDIAVP